MTFDGEVSNTTHTLSKRVCSRESEDCSSSEYEEHTSWSSDYDDNAGKTMAVISQLMPYTIYQFILQESGNHQSMGTWFQIETQEDTPQDFTSSYIKLSGSTSNSIVVGWELPGSPNGKITHVEVYTKKTSDGKKRAAPVGFMLFKNITETADLAMQTVTVTDLQSGTQYTISVHVCNR